MVQNEEKQKLAKREPWAGVEGHKDQDTFFERRARTQHVNVVLWLDAVDRQLSSGRGSSHAVYVYNLKARGMR